MDSQIPKGIHKTKTSYLENSAHLKQKLLENSKYQTAQWHFYKDTSQNRTML